MAQKTIQGRIQLKCDTEANWDKATNFVPLLGEVVVYTDDDTHHFSRLKVGDGETVVFNLPFIDAGSLEGISATDILTNQPTIEIDTLIDASSENVPTSKAVADYTGGRGFTWHYDISTTLSSNNWQGNSAPYSIVIENGVFTATNLTFIIPNPNLTNEQYEAFINAKIQRTAQTAGELTISAYGTKPSVDLPIAIAVFDPDIYQANGNKF